MGWYPLTLRLSTMAIAALAAPERIANSSNLLPSSLSMGKRVNEMEGWAIKVVESCRNNLKTLRSWLYLASSQLRCSRPG